MMPDKGAHFWFVFVLLLLGAVSSPGQTPVTVERAARENGAQTTTDGPGAVSTSATNLGGESVAKKIDLTTESLPMSAESAKPQSDPSDDWQFQLTPYLWIVGLSGQAGIGNLTVDVESGITDSNVHLNFGFMSTFEARKDRWVILTDLQYSNLGTERPTPGPLFTSAEAEFKTFILDPEVGYRIAGNPERGNVIDVLGGIRYWHLEADLEAVPIFGPVAVRSASRDWVDGVAGLRAKIHLTPKFFLSGKGDLGGGGSKFTYQLFGGAGFNIGKSIALVGGYRNLSVNYDKDNFLFDMSLHGPIFGVGIKF